MKTPSRDAARAMDELLSRGTVLRGLLLVCLAAGPAGCRQDSGASNWEPRVTAALIGTCGNGAIEPARVTQAELIWLATSCSGPRNISFHLSGGPALVFPAD